MEPYRQLSIATSCKYISRKYTSTAVMLFKKVQGTIQIWVSSWSCKTNYVFHWLTSKETRSSFWTISSLRASIKAIKKMIKSPIRPPSKIIQFNNFIGAPLVGFSVTTEFWKKKKIWHINAFIKYFESNEHTGGKRNQWEYFGISCPALPYPKTAPCRAIPGSRLVGTFTKEVGRKKSNI